MVIRVLTRKQQQHRLSAAVFARVHSESGT